MRNLSILVLMVLSSGAGFWLGQAHAHRRDGSNARPSVSGHINVVAEGHPLQAGIAVLSINVAGDKHPSQAGTAVLSNGLAVDGDIQMRSLSNGKVALEGNLDVSPH
jgi:hypothetical protein